jgi:hypothetical protein
MEEVTDAASAVHGLSQFQPHLVPNHNAKKFSTQVPFRGNYKIWLNYDDQIFSQTGF